jgi:hypothetical protein
MVGEKWLDATEKETLLVDLAQTHGLYADVAEQRECV